MLFLEILPKCAHLHSPLFRYGPSDILICCVTIWKHWANQKIPENKRLLSFDVVCLSFSSSTSSSSSSSCASISHVRSIKCMRKLTHGRHVVNSIDVSLSMYCSLAAGCLMIKCVGAGYNHSHVLWCISFFGKQPKRPNRTEHIRATHHTHAHAHTLRFIVRMMVAVSLSLLLLPLSFSLSRSSHSFSICLWRCHHLSIYLFILYTHRSHRCAARVRVSSSSMRMKEDNEINKMK